MKRKLKVWPDSYRVNGICCVDDSAPVAMMAHQCLKWQYSFALGFFGFHYIRAANENDHYLRRDSLQNLERLIRACNLNESLLKGLRMPEKRRFTDFWNDVLRIISISLGDSLGHESQQMVQLGFWLAAVNAGLVTELQGTSDRKKAVCLTILDNRLSDLTIPSQSSSIPARLMKPLDKLRTLLRRQNTGDTAKDIAQSLKSVLTAFLHIN